MKDFKEIMFSEAKAYNKKGKMYVFKEPKSIDSGSYKFDVLAYGKDTNGNPLIRIEIEGKKKSIQVPYSLSLDVDNIIKNGLSDKEVKELMTNM